MYNHYNFDISAKNIYILGDVHGNWGLLKYKIKDSGITNAIIIIAGDCGIGFEKAQFYINTYNGMKNLLKDSNVTILCVRGNHDDPSYYDGKVINFPYFKAIPDYSVITAGEEGNKHNILCVGGAISIDRTYRKRFDNERKAHGENRTLTYWFDEAPVYKSDILDEILNDGVNIKTVVTHTSPKFVPPTDKYGLESWLTNDNELETDTTKERNIMNQIYDHLIKDNHNIKNWFFGHYHQHRVYTSVDGVDFIMLDMMGTHNNSWDIRPLEIEKFG